jgi:hypothetical protein
MAVAWFRVSRNPLGLLGIDTRDFRLASAAVVAANGNVPVGAASVGKTTGDPRIGSPV